MTNDCSCDTWPFWPCCFFCVAKILLTCEVLFLCHYTAGEWWFRHVCHITSITAVALTGFPFQYNIAQTLMYIAIYFKNCLWVNSFNNLFIKRVDVFFLSFFLVPFEVYECARKSFLFETVTGWLKLCEKNTSLTFVCLNVDIFRQMSQTIRFKEIFASTFFV